MAEQYKFAYPADTQVLSQQYVDFIQHFYQLADDPNATPEFVDAFTEDGVFAVGSKRVEGREAIHKMRQGMWDTVVSRSHHPIAVFPGSIKSSGELEIMLHGTVTYGYHDGRECKDIEFATRGLLVTEKDGKTVKWKRYQAYMDSALLVPK